MYAGANCSWLIQVIFYFTKKGMQIVKVNPLCST